MAGWLILPKDVRALVIGMGLSCVYPYTKDVKIYCVDGYVVNSMTTDETLPLTMERQTVNVLVEGTHRKGGHSVTTVLVMTGTRVILVLE